MLEPDRAHELPLSRRWTPQRAAIIRRLCLWFFALVARVRVDGLEHVPQRGRCVLVFNHLSNFDAHLILGHLPRSDVSALAASEYASRPVECFLIEAGGGIWIRRGAADIRAIRNALTLLGDDWLLGISPEGGRTRTGGLNRGKPGAAALARRAGAPILPVAITGTEQIAASLKRLRRPVVTLTFGRPFHIPWTELEGSRKRQRSEATDQIMRTLAWMLPHSYAGVYGIHEDPRRRACDDLGLIPQRDPAPARFSSSAVAPAEAGG